MRKKMQLFFVLGTAALGGCGSSLPEVIFDATLASAKESLEDALDEAVDDFVDEWVDLDALNVDDEQPDE